VIDGRTENGSGTTTGGKRGFVCRPINAARQATDDTHAMPRAAFGNGLGDA
jgi:hypothetical protein